MIAAARAAAARARAALFRTAPEGCADEPRSRVLTAAGWAEVWIGPELNGYVVSVHCRFQVPHLAVGRVVGVNPATGKWNHYPDADVVEAEVVRLFARLWPGDLAEAQFLGAVGDVFDARRSWSWARVLLDHEKAARRRLAIISPRQPGRYLPGESYAEADARAFEAIVAEFRP